MSVTSLVIKAYAPLTLKNNLQRYSNLWTLPVFRFLLYKCRQPSPAVHRILLLTLGLGGRLRGRRLTVTVAGGNDNSSNITDRIIIGRHMLGKCLNATERRAVSLQASYMHTIVYIRRVKRRWVVYTECTL